MHITLTSGPVTFASARVLLVRSDMSLAIEGHCHENVISDVGVNAAGAYNIWLSNIEIRVPASGQTFQVNGLLRPWALEVTQESLIRGTTTVAVPPGGVFRITVMNAARLPVPHYKLMASTSDNATLEIRMNEHGTCLTYDNPTRCRILIDPGFGILIERLNMEGA